MGEIKKIERRHQSPWIMEVEVSSNQPRKKTIPETYGDLKSTIVPKLSKQARTSKSQNKPPSLADCKAMTFEYGDALISRDVSNDEFREHKKDDEKPPNQTEKEKPCLAEHNMKDDVTEKVSVSSELPVAKSKWGVKLRHVITRDSSIDDKTVEQPIYNFRDLSSKRSRPRSALYEESPKSVTNDVYQLCRSRSDDAILDSPNNENDSERLKFTSIFQRMKSFESNAKPDIGRTKDKCTPVKDPTKPISLEDLLNLDKQNLTVDVIDKGSEPVQEKENVGNAKLPSSRSNSLSRSQDTKIVLNSSSKNASDVKKESSSLNDVSQLDSSKTSDISDMSYQSDRSLSPKKKTVFGKMKSFQPRKAISLEELLKLDEKSLSIDVIEKSKSQQNISTDSKSVTNFKSENPFSI